MPKLYLLGGENVYRRSAKAINDQAFSDAGGRPRVLVVPWARPSFDKPYQKRKLLTDYFASLGASTVDFAEYEAMADVAEKIAAADLLYLTGGQASILIERAKKMGLDGLLRSFDGVIVGRSAGALALCRRCVTTVRNNGRVRVVDGLGLADITLKAHYHSEKDEALKRFSRETPIFAVPSNSALLWDEGEMSALGEVYVFSGGERLSYEKYRLT
ncbi:MAG: Type 1 glutamine amidotransferase-like domain-containing protein [Candidatus Bathyarchaeota archaeon]|nr:Type 1 glutamine amidotransferase-like domain-containing protein [Candidatus Bathyarchaeota archaeon]